MHILIAPQAFKGTLSAFEAAEAMQKGVLSFLPQAATTLIPVADGGDGTLDVVLKKNNGTISYTQVTGPTGRMLLVPWGLLNDTDQVMIEMAQVCGLAKLKEAERNPAFTSTYGLGELISKLLEKGHRRFLIGIGGSCTNDGGAGMAQALGACFLDRDGKELPLGGMALAQLSKIDLDHLNPLLQEAQFTVACDVLNPLLGPKGCSLVYSPQKGATAEMAAALEAAMRRYAEILKRDGAAGFETVPGAGAGGGAGVGLMVFCRAQLVPGIDLILEVLHFDHYLGQADLVITGEGRMDAQTQDNKAPLGVARAAKRFGLPVLAVVGSVGPGYENLLTQGIDAIIPASSILSGGTKATAGEVLTKATEQALRSFIMDRMDGE